MAPPPASDRRSGSFLNRAFSRRASGSLLGDGKQHPDQHAIEAFKQRLQQHNVVLTPQSRIVCAGDVDATLLRFLRARKMNLDAATNMLLDSLRWRQKVGADTALQVPLDPKLLQLCRDCRPSSYVAYDGQGRPIFLEMLGKIDHQRIEKSKLSVDDLLSYHLREMEYMSQVLFAEASAQAGHTVDKVITVVDASGLKLGTLTGFVQRMFRAITTMDSDNYPEAAAAIYVCNNSAAFTMIWRVVQGFVDKGTRDKINVFGSGKHMEKAMRDAGFAPHMLPTFLGGSLVFDEARQHWLGKMDAAMAHAQQQAAGQAQTGGASDKQHMLSPLALNTGRSGHEEDAGSDGFYTPTAASRAGSVSSVHSIYFDANMSFTDGSAPSSPRSGANTPRAGVGMQPHKPAGVPGHGASPLAGPRLQDAHAQQHGDSIEEGEGAQPRCLPRCGCCIS